MRQEGEAEGQSSTEFCVGEARGARDRGKEPAKRGEKSSEGGGGKGEIERAVFLMGRVVSRQRKTESNPVSGWKTAWINLQQVCWYLLYVCQS